MAAAAAEQKTKVLILYYSTYGHVKAMVDAAAEGVKAAGADVEIQCIPETLSDDVLAKMGAAGLKHSEGVKMWERDSDWHKADGFLFAFPTRYGMAPAQFRAFTDSTGSLWSSGALKGKPFGIITSSATQHGGNEATVLSTLPFGAAHGMVWVSAGFYGPQFDGSKVLGCTPYGPSTIAGGDGSRMPAPEELEVSKSYGGRVAKVAGALKGILGAGY